jgi:chromosome segregation ATPase
MVMADATDMSTPVTRGELRAELAQFEQTLEQKLAQRLAPLATKAELEVWGGALLARIESGEQRLLERIDGHGQRIDRLEQRFDRLEQRFDRFEQRFDRFEQRFDAFEQRFDGFEQRLLTELARHTQAIHESMSMQISVIDEKYADLPPRMSRLEAEVFAPKR